MSLKSFIVIMSLCLGILGATPMVSGSVMVYEDRASFDAFLATHPHGSVVDLPFSQTFGDLFVFSSNITQFPVFLEEYLFIPTDGNLLQATAFVGSDVFVAFGGNFRDVQGGIFSLFLDTELVWTRPDTRADFFLGASGVFDTFVISANTGSYIVDNVVYSYIPEPASLLLVGVGFLFIFPPLMRRQHLQD